MIPWLDDSGAAVLSPVFPSPVQALREPNGLLAAGGSLDPVWVLAAYRRGIFPWFSPGDPILWWSPDPRMVFFPEEIRISRSLRKVLRSGRFEVRCDSAFREVLAGCAGPRQGANGTWLVPAMQETYASLYEQGWAHSIETWCEGELVGGLYGVAIGRVFYGESMFHRVTDASKVAFAHLARLLQREGFAIVDCQMHTAHLASLGARELPRAQFLAKIAQHCAEGNRMGRWPVDHATLDWSG